MYDLDGMISRFAPDAIANDQMRHYAGSEAIQARLTSRKWLSQQVGSGVEQRIIWTFNPLVDGSVVRFRHAPLSTLYVNAPNPTILVNVAPT